MSSVTSERELVRQTLRNVFDAVSEYVVDNEVDSDDEFVQKMLELGMPHPFMKDVSGTMTISFDVSFSLEGLPNVDDLEDQIRDGISRIIEQGLVSHPEFCDLDIEVEGDLFSVEFDVGVLEYDDLDIYID